MLSWALPGSGHERERVGEQLAEPRRVAKMGGDPGTVLNRVSEEDLRDVYALASDGNQAHATGSASRSATSIRSFSLVGTYSPRAQRATLPHIASLLRTSFARLPAIEEFGSQDRCLRRDGAEGGRDERALEEAARVLPSRADHHRVDGARSGLTRVGAAGDFR